MEKWSMRRRTKNGMNNMEQSSERECGTDLDHAVEMLKKAILNSEEYNAYRAELDKVLQYPELKTQIDEFRKRNFELQLSADMDFEKLDRFEKEYEGFRSTPLVSDFLAAELAFCRKMQQIETAVMTAVDFQ